eukprot:1154470-Pelagomonas_calceolata.AAC.7
MPGVVSINYDNVDCDVGLCKMFGASFSKIFACGSTSEGGNVVSVALASRPGCYGVKGLVNRTAFTLEQDLSSVPIPRPR